MGIESNIDKLREHYLKMAPYQHDLIDTNDFTQQELMAIEKYGHWLEAIWRDKVPLITEKLKHFYLAKNRTCDHRTKIEELWFKYQQHRVPF